MQDINYKNIPNCLRKYRKARSLKQNEVAVMLGLKSTSVISRWENGACLPETLNVFKLSVIYRTMTDALYIDLMRQLKEDIRKKEENILKGK